jgi:hypothetical protein
MRINRRTRQAAMDLPLGPASFVLVVYEAVQGYCRRCCRYQTVCPLEIVEQHTATLRLMRQVSLLCRWLPAQRVCELMPVTPATPSTSTPKFPRHHYNHKKGCRTVPHAAAPSSYLRRALTLHRQSGAQCRRGSAAPPPAASEVQRAPSGGIPQGAFQLQS